ncbi:hypothetical protein BIW11_05451, partial [Tropilaelaps mercedesae]
VNYLKSLVWTNMSQDEAAECPLCMEPLELDDLSFYPCTCGYQICRFCWHRLRTDENGLCPACRKQYSEDPANFKPLSVDEMQQKAKNERKAKKQRLVENRKHLANVRVVQKNLVFVVGLPPRLACQEQLKRHECFGKFGKIHKVVVNQSTSYAGVQGPSASAYVTYFRSEDALRAIEAVNNVRVDGKTLKASLGTTKYCNHFLKGGQCPKSDCMYLHELGDEAASFTKEQMQAGKHTEYERRLHEQLNNTGGCGNNGSSYQRGGPKDGQLPQHQLHKYSQKENSCSNNKTAGQRSSPLPGSVRIPGNHAPTPPAVGTPTNNKQLQAKGGGGGVCGDVGGGGGHRSRHKSSECSSEEVSSCEEQVQQHSRKSPTTPLSERSDSPDLDRSPSPARHQQLRGCSPQKQYQLKNESPQSRQTILLRDDRRNHRQQQRLPSPCDTPPSTESSGDSLQKNSSATGKGVIHQLQSLSQLSLGRQVYPNHSVQDHLIHQQQQQHNVQQSLGIQQQQHHFQRQQHHHLQRTSSREQLPIAVNQPSSLVNDIELDFDPIYISRKGLADLIEREQHHPLGSSALTHSLPMSSSGPNASNSGNHLANLLAFGRIPPSRPSPPGIAPLSASSGHLSCGGHHIPNQATSGAYPPGLGSPVGPLPGLGGPSNQIGAPIPPPPGHHNSHGSPHQGMRRAPPPGFGPPMPPPPQQNSGPFGPFGQAPPPSMGSTGAHPNGSGGMSGYYSAGTDINSPGSSFGYRNYSGSQAGVVISGGVGSVAGSSHCDDLLNMKEQQEQLRQLLPSVNISFGPPPHHTPPSSGSQSMGGGNGNGPTSLAPPPGLMGALPPQHSQRQQPPMSILSQHSGVHGGLTGHNHGSLHHGTGHHGPSGWPETFQDPAILSSSRHIAQPSATTTGPADQRPSPFF